MCVGGWKGGARIASTLQGVGEKGEVRGGGAGTPFGYFVSEPADADAKQLPPGRFLRGRVAEKKQADALTSL